MKNIKKVKKFNKNKMSSNFRANHLIDTPIDLLSIWISSRLFVKIIIFIIINIIIKIIILSKLLFFFFK